MNLFNFFKRNKGFTVVTCAIRKVGPLKDVKTHFSTLEEALAFAKESVEWPEDPVAINHAEVFCNKSGTRVHHAYN